MVRYNPSRHIVMVYKMARSFLFMKMEKYGQRGNLKMENLMVFGEHGMKRET